MRVRDGLPCHSKDCVKHLLLSLFLVFSSLSFVAVDAHAQSKRLGRGATSGMSRQAPAPQPAQPVPAKQAAAPAAAGTAAAPAAVPKRSWIGPIAGLAAGLGLAALMSHLGMGAEFANILTLMLLAALAFFVGRFLLRRFGPGAASRNGMPVPQGMRFAGAGAGSDRSAREARPMSFGSGGARSDTSEPSFLFIAAAGTPSLPAGFDTAAFERIAKLVFIRMQAANDAGNLDDLRQFATPEMFATFRLDLQERGAAAQQTDVVQLDAQVLDFAEEAGQQIVSVRFHGLMREQQDAAATAFDEVWHLVKPLHGGSQWAIAGIAQSA